MVNREKHDLDYELVDEIDDVDDDMKLVLFWCRTHQT